MYKLVHLSYMDISFILAFKIWLCKFGYYVKHMSA
jgi:hypothetical protein